MSLTHSDIRSAIDPVTTNNHPVRLPPNPSWPAIEFHIRSEEEPGYPANAPKRWRNSVRIRIFSTSLSEVISLVPQIRSAIEPVTGYMGEEDSGDDEYEQDAQVYAYFIGFMIWTVDD